MLSFYHPVQIRRLAKVETDGWGAAELTLAGHTGTHLDAPAHFVAGGLTADCIPAERLVAPLIVVSIAEKGRATTTRSSPWTTCTPGSGATAPSRRAPSSPCTRGGKHGWRSPGASSTPTRLLALF